MGKEPEITHELVLTTLFILISNIYSSVSFLVQLLITPPAPPEFPVFGARGVWPEKIFAPQRTSRTSRPGTKAARVQITLSANMSLGKVIWQRTPLGK